MQTIARYPVPFLAAAVSIISVIAALPGAAMPAPTADPAGTIAGVTDADAKTGGTPAAHWYRQIAPALAEAERSGRLVMVDLYADWCGWCKKLDVEFKTDHFRRWAEDYVLLRVDVEDGGEGTALQSHLGVNALPTTAIIDHDKVRVGLFPGFRPAPQLTRSLDVTVATYRDKRKQLATLAQSDDPTERLQAADALRAMYAGAAAAEVYRSVLADFDSISAAGRARAGGALTDALLMTQDFAGARASLEAARKALAGADEEVRFRTERLLDNLSLRITQEMEDCQQVAELETFLAQRPASTFAGQARNRLDDLRTGPAAGCS